MEQRVAKVEMDEQYAEHDKEMAEDDRLGKLEEGLTDKLDKLEQQLKTETDKTSKTIKKVDNQISSLKSNAKKESEKVNHLTDRTDTNTFILHNLIWIVHLPHHDVNAFHEVIQNISDMFLKKYSEHLYKGYHKFPNLALET